MACYDADDFICTYDSGGDGSLPGEGNPDYSSLATWEGESDNDLSGTGITILDCYDSQNHNDGCVTYSGASNTDSTHYRCVRSSPSCVTPFAGKVATGANFVRPDIDNGNHWAHLGENYFRLQDLYISSYGYQTFTLYAVYVYNVTDCKAINVVATQKNTYGTVEGSGFQFKYVSGPCLFFNCIAFECEDDGFVYSPLGGSPSGYVICCTAIDNERYGFYASGATGIGACFSCYGKNVSGEFIGAFSGYWDAPSAWNAANDDSASCDGNAGDDYKNSIDLVGSGELDANYFPANGMVCFSGEAGDRAGRNPYDHISSGELFDNFFGPSGEAISRKDIRGIDRPSGEDAYWSVGAAEYAEEEEEEISGEVQPIVFVAS